MVLSLSLLSLPPSSYRSPPRRRTFGLAKMRMWAGEGKYRRLDQLQADLLAVLRQAREEGGRDSQVRSPFLRGCGLIIDSTSPGLDAH